MKKYLLSMLLFAAPIIVFAQLKVAADGKVYVKKTGGTQNASLAIGDIPNSNFDECYDSDTKYGIHAQQYDTQNKAYNIGILGEAKKSQAQGYSIGMWGDACGGASYQNIGVVATIPPDVTGTALYATSEGGPGPFTNGIYAGYFYGDTYMDGTLTVYNLYNLSDIRLKKDVVPLNELTKSEGSTLDRLQDLEVLEYRIVPPSQLNNNAAKGLKQDSEREKRMAEQRHYGVSAQELQKVFPHLVQEGQDGYLTVNYTELVPILLHSIQELKRQIDVLQVKTTDDENLSREDNRDDLLSSTSLLNNTSGNVLYQNTPNPFTGSTTIRFRLSDDARDAAICIFDMSGKMQRQIPVDSRMESIVVNAGDLSAGLYLYSLVVNGQEIDTKRMIIK